MNIFETNRLYVRKAEPIQSDSEILAKLHNNPDVMKYVGFPKGLQVTFEEEAEFTKKNYDIDNARLLIHKKVDDVCIGACKVGIPNSEGFCEIDYKLFPKFQGVGYGAEMVKGLAKFIFEIKKYKGIETSPNKKNIASQKICEKIGMRKVSKGIWRAPKNKKNIIDVPYYKYQITNKEYFSINN